jgi:hypothetical protein
MRDAPRCAEIKGNALLTVACEPTLRGSVIKKET